ncbi:hypothetical protein BH10BAC5_BH10BAC5_23730 [soil metagenome]
MDLINQSSIEDLRAMDDGQGIFLKDILGLYLYESVNILEDIIANSDSENYDAMSKSAHKLKGSSLSVGATGLAEICAVFEKKPDFNVTDKEQLKVNLRDLYNATKEEFNKIISSD